MKGAVAVEKYILGGYLLVKPLCPEGDNLWLSNNVISASNCVCDVLPGTHFIETLKSEWLEEHLKTISGLNDHEYFSLEQWVIEKFNDNLFSWPGFFTEMWSAKECRERYFSKVDDLYLLALGLPEREVELFINEAPSAHCLLASTLQKKIYMNNDDIIGFELLGAGWQDFHSHSCHGLQTEFSRELGIIPNEYGLLRCHDDAYKAMQYVEELPDEKDVEEGLWQPWVIGLIDRYHNDTNNS